MVPIVCDLREWKNAREKINLKIPADKPIHFLVNNAGASGMANFEDITEQELDR